MPRMRYRKPSVKTLLGVTKWKKRAKKALGITAVMKPFRFMGNYKRRVLRQAGYYDEDMKMMRAMERGQVAGPLGPLQVGEKHSHKKGDSDDNSLLMMAALAQQGHKSGRGKKDDDDGPGLAGAMLMAAAMGGDKDKDGDGPGVAEAMLMAAAMSGDKDKNDDKPKERRTRTRAKRTPARNDDDDDKPTRRSHHSTREKKKPRRRGLGIFGLVLTALLVAVLITGVWYFWLA